MPSEEDGLGRTVPDALQFPLMALDPELESSVSSFKDGLDDEIGIEDRKIVSLYLQRQDDDQDAKKYRDYLLNPETIKASRRKQLFKQKEAYEEGKQQLNYTIYKQRRCVVGIPKAAGSPKCGCGRPLTDSTHVTFQTNDVGTWDFRQHTVVEDTNAYGRIIFDGNQRSKYVRLDTETSSKLLTDLMNNVFNLQTPGVIISVVGSLIGFTVTSKIEKIIQRGMIKAAITTNGWITTSGFDAGHIKSVGSALKMHNHAVPCVGFPSWGCVPPRVQEALVVKQNKKKKGENQCKYPRTEIPPGSAFENLEKNHSHFILSDTGGISDWGSECYLRTRWEAYMQDELNIPVVQIVLQGGIGVCRTLLNALKAGTPAVIVYGSGGVSDVLVDLIRHDDALAVKGDRKIHKFSLKKKTKKKTSVVSDNQLGCSCSENGINFECPIVQEFMIKADLTHEARYKKSFLSRLKEMITEYRDLLILFDMDDDHYDGLDAALLEALVKAQNMKSEELGGGKTAGMQLSGVQVALGWNRPDFAEKLLNADNAASDEKALGSLLIHALAWDLFEFTELLLTHGASIPMVAANVVVLYNSSYNLDHLKRFVRYNMGVDKGEITFRKDTIDGMINKLLGKRNKFNSNVGLEADPYFELMVWAALSLYPEIAELMWKGTQEPIRAALFVVMISRKLAKAPKVIINANEDSTLEQIKARFEHLAITILDNLHENCERSLRDRAIHSCWERLNGLNYIDMAHQCRAKNFVAHPACQEISERRWKRGLTSEVNLWVAILVTLCPLLLMTRLVTFRSDWVSWKEDSIIRKFWKKIMAFSISPSVKFWLGVEMYIIFVVFQTHTILTKLGSERRDITAQEIILFVWFGILLLDEILQIIDHGHLGDWWSGIWNKVDMLMYLFNLAGFILCHIPCRNCDGRHYDATCYNTGRILLSVSCILFYHRILHMFTSDSVLGPTLLMIKRMVRDLKVFLLLLLIVATGFGVGYAVVLTNPADWENPDYTKTMLAGMVFYPFFQMFGELYVDDLGSANATVYFPGSRSHERSSFAVVLAAIYLSIVVLMLVNILIAMFSDTYTRVKDREDVIFKFQRLELLMEMENSYLPPPFSFLHFLLSIFVEKKKKEKARMNDKAEDENKWFDTVIRSAVIDSLEEHLKRERVERGSATEALMQDHAKMLKQKLYKLHIYIQNVQATVDSNHTDITDYIRSCGGLSSVEEEQRGE